MQISQADSGSQKVLAMCSFSKERLRNAAASITGYASAETSLAAAGGHPGEVVHPKVKRGRKSMAEHLMPMREELDALMRSFDKINLKADRRQSLRVDLPAH